MSEFRVVKPFRVSATHPMHLPGSVVDSGDFDDAFFDKLIGLGIVEDSSAIVSGDTDDEPEDDDSSESVDAVDEPVEEPKSSGYPKLPRKAAPVAEWEEYARRNEIKLTGLKTRNAKIGYITKVVSGS